MRSLPVLQPLCVLPVIRKHSISVGEDRRGARERNARRKFRAAVLPHYYYYYYCYYYHYHCYYDCYCYDYCYDYYYDYYYYYYY